MSWMHITSLQCTCCFLCNGLVKSTMWTGISPQPLEIKWLDCISQVCSTELFFFVDHLQVSSHDAPLMRQRVAIKHEPKWRDFFIWQLPGPENYAQHALCSWKVRMLTVCWTRTWRHQPYFSRNDIRTQCVMLQVDIQQGRGRCHLFTQCAKAE